MAARSLLVVAVVAGCAPAVAPAPGAPRAAAGPSVELVDEVARFHVGQLRAPVVERDDGVVVIARTAANERAWTIEALDGALHARWAVPLTGRLDGLIGLEGDRVLAVVDTGTFDKPSLEAIVLGGGGEQVARATFASLTGATCRVGNAYFLGRVEHEVVAQVACDGRLVRVWLDRDLRAVHQTADGSAWPMYVPDAWIDDRGPEVTLRRGDARVLSIPKARTGALAAPSLAAVDGDLVFAMSVNDTREAALRPRFSARGVVRREGVRPWAVDLVGAHLTDDPTTIAGVGATRAGDVLVTIGYGRDGRVAGAQLPTPSYAPDARFPELADHLAVAELEGATGVTRRVLALRPRTTWNVQRLFASVAATPSHVFVVAGEELVVFPRRGAPIGPSVASAEAPPVPAALPAFAPGRVASVAATWARVCGTRQPQKSPAPCAIAGVALGTDGTIAITGGYYGTNQLDATRLPRRAYESGIVAVFAPDGALRWHTELGASWHNAGAQVVVRDDGAVVITGVHGLGFAIGDRRIPDRAVARGEEFDAVSPFVAVFDRSGRVELLEDVDVLAFGDRSTDPRRTCSAAIAAGAAPDEVWLRAGCAGGDRRILLRGATVASTEHFPGSRAFATRAIDARGALLDTFTDLYATSLLVDAGAQRRRIPLFGRAEPSALATATSPAGTWHAAIVPSVTAGGTWRKAIELARVAPDGTATAHELVADGLTDGARVSLDGLTVDDRGRPILSIVYREAFTLAGVALPAAQRIGSYDPRGHVIVRLTADGSAIDRMFVPDGSRGGCVAPWYGYTKAMAARGDRLAVLFEAGVTCPDVKDTPTTLVVYDAW